MNTYVDVETGELLNGILVTQEELKKKKNRNDFIQYQKSQDNLSIYIDDQFGSFYFNNYKKLLEKVDNDTALAFRFLYLCTFADYNNKLVYNGIRMKERDMAYLLNVSSSMFFEIKRKLYDYHLIFKNEHNEIRINSLYYIRGKINARFKQESSRVFDDGIRNLYQSSSVTEHKKISILIPLLIYTNNHLNILCHNINETNPDNIQPLTLKEISEIVGYDYNNISKITGFLKSVVIKGRPLLARVTHINGDFYIVNPALFYKGNNLENLCQIEKLFKLKNR